MSFTTQRTKAYILIHDVT